MSYLSGVCRFSDLLVVVKRMTLVMISTTLRFLIISVVISLPTGLLAAESVLTVRPILTLDIAKRIAAACEARQIQEKRPPVTIAIFDQGANMVLFHRMAGATLGATAVAMEKGKSTAHFPVSTRQWATAAHGEKGSLGIAFLPNITTFTGGVPIITEGGIHLGGIGVSGSSGDDDEACALAGLDVVKKHLSKPPN